MSAPAGKTPAAGKASRAPVSHGKRQRRAKDKPQPYGETTRFSLPAIGAAIGIDPDALRKWFAEGPQGGGLVLMPPMDEPAASGGRPHLLGWRTAVALMLACRLNAFGFTLRGGEASAIAGQVLKAGLAFEHLWVEARPLISVVAMSDGSLAAALIRRDAPAGYCESAESEFAAIGTLLIDPASFGLILAGIVTREIAADA